LKNTLEKKKPYQINVVMGGGTFLKVGGGKSASQKNYRKILWFELVTVTSQVLKYDVIMFCEHGSNFMQCFLAFNSPYPGL